MLLLVMTVLFVNVGAVSAEEDCRVVSLKKSANSNIFRFTLNLKDAPAIGWVAFKIYKEQKELDFVSYEKIVGGIGEFDMEFIPGEIIEFSIGVTTDRIVEYLVNTNCSKYAYKGHLRVRVEEGNMLVTDSAPLSPGIMLLLHKNKK